MDTWYLALEGLRGRKRSSRLLLLVLTLTFAFVVTVLSISSSLTRTEEENRYDTYGTWKAALYQQSLSTAQRLEGIGDSLGISKLYGTAVNDGGAACGVVGTIDDTLRTMGRLSCVDGDFPIASDEVAIEASVLSALGYHYTLGQEITLTVETGAGDWVTQSYTLVGVVKEYSSLWQSGGAPLANILLVDGAENDSLYSPEVCNLFVGGSQSIEELQQTLSTWEGAIYNTNAYGSESETSPSLLMLGSILLITLLSVSLISNIQMEQRTRTITLLRSIGATRRTQWQLTLWEGVFLMVPAAVLGLGFGTGLTWLGLRLVIGVAGNALYLDIPVTSIAAVLGIWLLCGWAGMLLPLLRAFRVPLTGGLRESPGRRRLRRTLQRVGTGLLSLLMGLVLRRRRMGFVFQAFNLLGEYKVRENILLPLLLDRKRPDKQFFGDVVEALGIGALLKKYPDQLSGGEQQRVAIARSLMAQPQLIFADEPTGNLDKKTSTQVLELLTQTASRFGQTVIMVTHDLEIASTAQRVVHIEDGRLV